MTRKKISGMANDAMPQILSMLLGFLMGWIYQFYIGNSQLDSFKVDHLANVGVQMVWLSMVMMATYLRPAREFDPAESLFLFFLTFSVSFGTGMVGGIILASPIRVYLPTILLWFVSASVNTSYWLSGGMSRVHQKEVIVSHRDAYSWHVANVFDALYTAEQRKLCDKLAKALALGQIGLILPEATGQQVPEGEFLWAQVETAIWGIQGSSVVKSLESAKADILSGEYRKR